MDHKKIADLVRQVKSGDSQAFESLYELTYQKTYFFALSMLKNEQDAQDAVQEIYIKVLSSIKDLENNRLFIAWVNRIAYNICVLLLSKRRDFSVDENTFASIPDESDEGSPILCAMKNERSRILMMEIDRLDPTLKATIILKYYENLKISEIASIMDCPEGTVKSRLSNGKKALRFGLNRMNRCDIMFAFVSTPPLKNALRECANGISLNGEVAHRFLVESLIYSNMSTNVHFTPQIPIALFSGSAPVIAASGVGGAFVATIGALTIALTPPTFTQINVPSEFTSGNATIVASVDMIGDLESFYCQSSSGERFNGISLGNDLYSVSLPENGDYVLYGKGYSDKLASSSITISCIDREGPVVASYSYDSNKVVVRIQDDKSGVDFNSITIVTDSGNIITPIDVRIDVNEIIFPFPEERSYIVLMDLVGNSSKHLVKLF